MHSGLKHLGKVSSKSGSLGFARRRHYISGIRHVDDVKVPFNTAWGAVPLPQYVTVIKRGFEHRARVRWNIGGYTAGTAGSYQITGTILCPKTSNPLELTADLTVEVEHEAKSILASATSVYYDFCRLYNTTGALVSGEQGLEDLGGLGFDATPINGCGRSRLLETNSILYGISRTNDDCVSTGNPLLSILTQNRIDIFLCFATTDGVPAGTTTLIGATITGPPAYTFNVFNTGGRMNVVYNDSTNNFTWQSNVTMSNGQIVGSVYHIKIDFTADTVTATKDGSALGGSVISGTVSSINPAAYNNSNNVYVGATNSNGSVTSCTEIVTMYRAALCANITDADATKIVDYFRFYKYPHSSFSVPFLLGDSQSEGAAETGRLTNDGRYTTTPGEVTIYHKTARDSSDNGTWQGLTAGSNNELIGGTVFSAEVSLSRNIQLRTTGNVHLIKAGASGASLTVDWNPSTGTSYDVAMNYYWSVAKTKLLASHPSKRIKPVILINLLTNDQGQATTRQNLASKINEFIAAVRAFDTLFASCPIYWTEVDTNIWNGTQLKMNAALRKYCSKNRNIYFVSSVPKDRLFHRFQSTSRNDRVEKEQRRLLAKRKIDLTTAQKLGVTATTNGGVDDEHRSYLGMIAEGEVIYNHLLTIGFV